ncbi:MAG: hypothetical protein KatS3mg077_2743 [Candidatus Binatia bacterium]|nr:MAG: hypothetical protein KatS3mg077_2743 [Candidatus Binatia bacterium]
MAESNDRPTLTPSFEDLILLESTVETLRQERDQLLRRLQAQDSAARERIQAAESRYREAVAQVDALKRAAQQIREQLEARLAEAASQIELAGAQAQQWQLAAEGLRRRAAELETFLEAAQGRVADLETENAVLQAEIERLQIALAHAETESANLRAAWTLSENQRGRSASRAAALRQAFDALAARTSLLARQLAAALQVASDRKEENQALASALEQARDRVRELEEQTVELSRALDRLRADHEEALRKRQQEWNEKCEAWIQERDALARSVEEEQNRSVALEREIGALRAQLCSLQMRSQSDAEEVARLESELAATREELQRERGIFEELAQRRDADWNLKLEELAAAFARYRQSSEDTIEELRRRLEEAHLASDLAAEEIRRLQGAIDAAAMERAEREAEIQRYMAVVESLQASCKEAHDRRAEADATVTALRRELSHLEAKLAETSARVEAQQSALDEERQRSSAARQEWEAERAALRRAIEELELEREQVEHDLEQACWHLGEIDAALQRSTVELHAAVLAASEARSASAQWELAYRRLAQSYAALETRHDEETGALSARFNRVAELLRALEEQRGALLQRHTILRGELETERRLRAEAEEAYRSLQQRWHELERELAARRDALQEAETRARQLASELEDEHRSAARARALQEQELAARDEEIAALRQYRDALRSEVQELRSKLAEAIARSEEVRRSLDEEVATLRHELSDWKQQAQTAEAQIAELSEIVTRQEEALRTSRDRLQQEEVERRNLQSRLQELVAQCEEYRAARDRALAELEQTRQHLEALQEQSVGILQAQEILTQENQSLREALEGEIRERQRLEGLYTQVRHERDQAMARWEESEKLRQKENASYLAIRQQLDSERDTLRAALDSARAQQAQLQAQITLLQRDKAGRTPAVHAELLELERERAELKAQVEKLSAVIRQLGQEREEQRVAALQAQAALNARIDELAAERGALTLRVAELETLVSQLDRECERLRKERLSPEELRKYKAEVARLEARVEELERLRAEAAQNHSAVVAGYLLELNQRTEALQEKEAELQEVQRQVEALQANLEELQERLEAEQEERSQLEAALDELRRAAAGGAMRAEPKAAAKIAATASPTGVKNTAPLRLADSKTPFGPSDAGHKKGLARLRDASPLTVVHLEENKVCRDQVQRLLKQLPAVRYLNTLDVGDATKGGAMLLAVNLLNRAHDPIAALARIVHRPEEAGIFAYCSEGKFGFLFGEATFFTSPFDVDACSSWLLSTFGTVQRLLVASNNIEMTSQLRNALTKIRCSASVALDFRQVLELVPLIHPEVVLVDLSLPRAEGLRLVSRLRNDEKTAGLPLGVILPEHQRVAEFRQNAVRAAREGSLSVDTIVQALARELGLAPPAASPESSGDAPGKAAPSSR